MPVNFDELKRQASQYAEGQKNAPSAEQIAEKVRTTGSGSLGKIGGGSLAKVPSPSEPNPPGGGSAPQYTATQAPSVPSAPSSSESSSAAMPFGLLYDPKRGFGSADQAGKDWNDLMAGKGNLADIVSKAAQSLIPNVQDAVQTNLVTAGMTAEEKARADAAWKSLTSTPSPGFGVGTAFQHGTPEQQARNAELSKIVADANARGNAGGVAQALQKTINLAGALLPMPAQASERAIGTISQLTGITPGAIEAGTKLTGTQAWTEIPQIIMKSVVGQLINQPFVQKFLTDKSEEFSNSVRGSLPSVIAEPIVSAIQGMIVGNPNDPVTIRGGLAHQPDVTEMLSVAKGIIQKMGGDPTFIDQALRFVEPDQARRDGIQQIVDGVQADMFQIKSYDDLRNKTLAGSFTYEGTARMAEAVHRLNAGEDWNTVQSDITSRLTTSEFVNDLALNMAIDPLNPIAEKAFGGFAGWIQEQRVQKFREAFVAVTEHEGILMKEPALVSFSKKLGPLGEKTIGWLAKETNPTAITKVVEEMGDLFSGIATTINTEKSVVRLADLGVSEAPQMVFLRYLASDGKTFRTAEGALLDGEKVREALGIAPRLSNAQDVVTWGVKEGEVLDPLMTRTGQNLRHAMQDMSVRKDTQMLDAYNQLVENMATAAETGMSRAEWQDKIAGQTKKFFDTLTDTTWKLSGLERAPTKLENAQSFWGLGQKVMANFQITFNPGNTIRNAGVDTVKMFLNHVDALTPWRTASQDAAEYGLITSALGRETVGQQAEAFGGGKGAFDRALNFLREKSPNVQINSKLEMERQIKVNLAGYKKSMLSAWKDLIPEAGIVGKTAGETVMGWDDVKKVLSEEHYNQLRAKLAVPPKPSELKSFMKDWGAVEFGDERLVKALNDADIMPEARQIILNSNGTVDDQLRLLEELRTSGRDSVSNTRWNLTTKDSVSAQVDEATRGIVDQIKTLSPAQKGKMMDEQRRVTHALNDWHTRLTDMAMTFLDEHRAWAKTLKDQNDMIEALDEVDRVKNEVIKLSDAIGFGREDRNLRTGEVLNQLWAADTAYDQGMSMAQALAGSGLDPSIPAFQGITNPTDMWAAWNAYRNSEWIKVYQQSGTDLAQIVDKYANGLGREAFLNLAQENVAGYFVTQPWRAENYNKLIGMMQEKRFTGLENFNNWLKKNKFISEDAFFGPDHIKNEAWLEDVLKKMDMHEARKATELKPIGDTLSYNALKDARTRLNMTEPEFDAFLSEHGFIQSGQTVARPTYALDEAGNPRNLARPTQVVPNLEKKKQLENAVEEMVRSQRKAQKFAGKSAESLLNENQSTASVSEWAKHQRDYINQRIAEGIDRKQALEEFKAANPSPLGKARGSGVAEGAQGVVGEQISQAASGAPSAAAPKSVDELAAQMEGSINREKVAQSTEAITANLPAEQIQARAAEQRAARGISGTDTSETRRLKEQTDAITKMMNIGNHQAVELAKRELALDQLSVYLRNGGTTKAEKFTVEEAKVVRDFLQGTVIPRYNEAHMVSKQVGKAFQDMLLFNYGDKRNFDAAMGMLFNYPRWYARNLAYYASYAYRDPPVVTALLKGRAEIQRSNEGKPDWWKDQINLDIAGKHVSIPILAAIDGLNSWMGDKFYDSDMAKTAVGGALQDVQNYGPGLNVNVNMIMAMQAHLAGDESQASAWMNSFGPPTSAFRALTAIAKENGVQGIPAGGIMPEAFLEPWLNDQDAEGNVFTAGTKYDQRRWGLALSQLVQEGKITQEQAYDVVSHPAGDIFDMVRQRAELNIAGSVLGSFFVGAGFRPRDETEMQVAQMDIDRAALISAYNNNEITTEEWRQQWNDMRDKYPFMDFVIAFRRDSPERDRIYAWSVFDRLPPNSSSYFAALGYDTKQTRVMNDMLDKFYASKGHMDEWTDQDGVKHPAWDPRDKEFFMTTMHSLGAVLALPQDARPEEWQRARASYTAMRATLDRMYSEPGAQGSIFALQDRYYQITDANEAKIFLTAHPVLQDMWNKKDELVAADPMLFKYYGSLDLLSRLRTDDFVARMEVKYPGIGKLWDQYSQYKQAGDTQAASMMFKQHPEMSAYLTEKNIFDAGLGAELDKIGNALNAMAPSWAVMRSDVGANVPTSLQTISDLIRSGARPMGQFELPPTMDAKTLAAQISLQYDSASKAGGASKLWSELKKMGLDKTLTAFQALRNTGTVSANMTELGALLAAMDQIRAAAGWKLLTADSNLLANSSLGPTTGKRIRSTTYYSYGGGHHGGGGGGGGGGGVGAGTIERLSQLQGSQPNVWQGLQTMALMNADAIEAYLSGNPWLMDAIEALIAEGYSLAQLIAGVRKMAKLGVKAKLGKKKAKTIPNPPRYNVPALSGR